MNEYPCRVAINGCLMLLRLDEVIKRMNVVYFMDRYPQLRDSAGTFVCYADETKVITDTNFQNPFFAILAASAFRLPIILRFGSPKHTVVLARCP